MFKVDAATGEIFVYDFIGPEQFGGIDDGMIVNALQELGDKRALVRINSPGGDCDVGMSIYNALKRHPAGVDTVVDSLAASCGSYLMLAGETRTIAENGRVMIHKPWGMAWGNAPEMRRYADLLDLYEGSMLSAYQQVTNMAPEELEEALEAETWYNAEQALAYGFATVIDGDLDVEPERVPSGLYAHAPEAVIDRNATPSGIAAAMRSAWDRENVNHGLRGDAEEPKKTDALDTARTTQAILRHRLKALRRG